VRHKGAEAGGPPPPGKKKGGGEGDAVAGVHLLPWAHAAVHDEAVPRGDWAAVQKGTVAEEVLEGAGGAAVEEGAVEGKRDFAWAAGGGDEGAAHGLVPAGGREKGVSGREKAAALQEAERP
jgi:hypothetical protein